MLEKDLWAKIRDNPLNLNVFFQRIESSTADGIPDLFFRQPSFGDGWCELKYMEPTVRGGYTLSLGKYPLVQRDWNAKYSRAGGIALLCIGIGDKVFWLHGRKSVTILKFNIGEIAEWAFHEGVEFPKKSPL